MLVPPWFGRQGWVANWNPGGMAGAEGQGPPSVRPFLGLVEAARGGRCARARVPPGRGRAQTPGLRWSWGSARAPAGAKLQRAGRDPKAGPDGILSPGASRRWLRLGSKLWPFLLYAQDMPLNKTSFSLSVLPVTSSRLCSQRELQRLFTSTFSPPSVFLEPTSARRWSPTAPLKCLFVRATKDQC